MKLLLAVLFLPLLAWAEPATTIRAAELKKEPAIDAETLIELPENTAVDAAERKGGWVRVKARGSEGWLKMLSLRYGNPASAKKGDTGISQMFNVARTGSSGTQVTTGVRGLDEKELANAQPNASELAKLDKFAADADGAARFAANGKLGAKTVDYPK
ncbi:MAG TPA: hypothetical protein VEQ87_00450 [Burkholderiales bacterium]|nr:hypothetical protein [Burkholderiales bacterium]